MTGSGKPRVLIVGGGFGGLACAKALGGEDVEVTLVDRNNHHVFQPLLYQVAMAALSPADIAVPIRSVLSRYPNVRTLLGEVTDVALDARRVTLADGEQLAYDYLVLAPGAVTSYFGHDAWAQHARGLKDIDDALAVRERMLLAFEAAEREPDPERRARLLTFVVIGGGPTGVELAGALAELARTVLAKDYRAIDPRQARIVLVEMADRLLKAQMPPELSHEAERALRRLGVELRLSTAVTEIDAEGVTLGAARIPAANVVWAAGVRTHGLVAKLGAPVDRAGRVPVAPDCSLPGRPEVFVVGDAASLAGEDATPLPGIAPVATQQGRAVAANIARDLRGSQRRPFHYFDKGMLATIGRGRAVGMVGRAKFAGWLAWLAWTFVHIWFLVGFRSRVLVFLEWIWAYVTYTRGARLITHRRA